MHTRSTRSKTASQVAAPVEKVEKVKKIANKSKSAKAQNTDALVASIISSIKEDNSKSVDSDNSPDTNDKSANEVKPVAPKKVNAVKPVRGLPKSGRPWKDVKQKWVQSTRESPQILNLFLFIRFNKVKKSIYRQPVAKKEKLRHDLKHIKELSRTIKEEKKQENLDKKQRREDNAQRRLENERKSEIVQIIKNPAKLKRMKKKALRKIEKRDLDAGTGPKVVWVSRIC